MDLYPPTQIDCSVADPAKVIQLNNSFRERLLSPPTGVVDIQDRPAPCEVTCSHYPTKMGVFLHQRRAGRARDLLWVAAVFAQQVTIPSPNNGKLHDLAREKERALWYIGTIYPRCDVLRRMTNIRWPGKQHIIMFYVWWYIWFSWRKHKQECSPTSTKLIGFTYESWLREIPSNNEVSKNHWQDLHLTYSDKLIISMHIIQKEFSCSCNGQRTIYSYLFIWLDLELVSIKQRKKNI